MLSKLRMLASDAAVYGITTLLTRSLSFLLTPLYTHYLHSHADFGIYANLYSWIAFVNVVYSFGFDTAFLRFYDKNDMQASRRAFSIAWLGMALISITFTILIMLGANTLSALLTGSNPQIIIAMSLIPLFDALTIVPYNLLRMQRRARRFAVLRIVNVSLNLLLNILFVAWLDMGIWGIILAGAMASGMAVIMILPELIAFLGLSQDHILFKAMLRFGLPTLPSAFSGIMLQVADRPVMTALAGPDITGLYQANYRMGIPMMMAVSVFEFAYKPFYLSHYQDEGSQKLFARIFTYFTLLCGAVYLGISLFIRDIVHVHIGSISLLHSSYLNGLHIVPIILAAYYFNGAATNFAAAMHITRQTGWLPAATGIAALMNILLNFLLIPMIGMAGGAWATLGAYMLSALVLWLAARRIYPIPYEWKRIIAIILLSLILSVPAFMPRASLWLRLLAMAAYPIAVLAGPLLTKGEKQMLHRKFFSLISRTK
jgi:O-antigen/teichoic acid export membrane protein